RDHDQSALQKLGPHLQQRCHHYLGGVGSLAPSQRNGAPGRQELSYERPGARTIVIPGPHTKPAENPAAFFAPMGRGILNRQFQTGFGPCATKRSSWKATGIKSATRCRYS